MTVMKSVLIGDRLRPAAGSLIAANRRAQVLEIVALRLADSVARSKMTVVVVVPAITEVSRVVTRRMALDVMTAHHDDVSYRQSSALSWGA
jgi:hypothetical protein